MFKCGKCSSDIKQGDLSARCMDCNKGFHTTCMQLGSQKRKVKIGSVRVALWKLAYCYLHVVVLMSHQPQPLTVKC